VPSPSNREINLADEFMPPSARIGDQEARRLGLMKQEPAREVTLESLSTEPPAGPTVMQKTHERAMHRVLGYLKNRFKNPEQAEESVNHAALLYLREWEKTYRQGVRETASPVDRTILDIRRDTVVQIMAEIGRQPTVGRTVSGSPHGSGAPGDRPSDGLPPADL
jgi:hypothetical protein